MHRLRYRPSRLKLVALAALLALLAVACDRGGFSRLRAPADVAAEAV